jgi:predicted Zn finger-like uncharacterized protein
MAGHVFTASNNEGIAFLTMSMNTTCPKCSTSFRINSEQLAARDGKVRCGRCSHVFNGFMHLGTPIEPLAERSLPVRPTEVKPIPDKPTKYVIDTPTTTSPPPLQITPEPDKPIDPDIDLPIKILPDAAMPSHFEIHQPALPAEFLASHEIDAPSRPDVFHTKHENDFSARTIDTNAPTFDPDFDLPDIGPLLEPDPEYASNKPAQRIEAYSPSAAPIPAPASKPKLKTRITQPQAFTEQADVTERDPLLDYFPGEDENEDETEFDGPTLLDDAANKRAKPHWIWALGGGLLFFVGALQAVYLYRVEIAQALPDARPLMTQACEMVGCQLGLPQNFDQLSIESSDLVADPQKPDQIELRATLRNKARYVQAFPHLDLILTNAQDDTLVKRVIAPNTYLKPPATSATGFAPNSEINVKLQFKAQDVKPAGYRLQLIYP